jgi:hypothetical protein
MKGSQYWCIHEISCRGKDGRRRLPWAKVASGARYFESRRLIASEARSETEGRRKVALASTLRSKLSGEKTVAEGSLGPKSRGLNATLPKAPGEKPPKAACAKAQGAEASTSPYSSARPLLPLLPDQPRSCGSDPASVTAQGPERHAGSLPMAARLVTAA